MFIIHAPDGYERTIAGVVFQNGEGVTCDPWIASWFSGREGFTVEPKEKPEKPKEKSEKPKSRK